MPGYPTFAENRSGTWAQSQVGHTVPSTSTVPRPTTSRGSGTTSARTSPDHGPQQVPTTADGGLADPEHRPGEILGHVRAYQAHHHRHGATDRNRPSARGRPAETNLSPHNMFTRATRSVSCSSSSPVIASYRNSSCPLHFDVCPTTKQNGKSCCASSVTRALAQIDTPAWLSEMFPRIRVDKVGWTLVNKVPGCAGEIDVAEAAPAESEAVDVACEVRVGPDQETSRVDAGGDARGRVRYGKDLVDAAREG